MPQSHRDRHRDARRREGRGDLVNVNYRYVEGELRYLFDNSDMVALVHERQYADRVANVLPETPNVTTVLVVEDGTDMGLPALRAWSSTSDRAGSPSATSANAAPTTSTSSTPAAPPASPKGVMWRHEDIYRVLLGGTDFATGQFVEDEYDHAKQAAAARR